MNITYSSAVDGEGFRDTLFLCGCPHHCDGCHNPQTWDAKNGTQMSVDEVYTLLCQSNVTNVTYSGGEPLVQCSALIELSRRLTTEAHKTIWIYSGYEFEQVIINSEVKELLKYCEVMVDGPFKKELAPFNLRFRGSTNQRIIDLEKTFKEDKVVLWEDWA